MQIPTKQTPTEGAQSTLCQMSFENRANLQVI